MPQISITLVDHTQGNADSDHLRHLIQFHLEAIFTDLLYSDVDATVINTRWSSAGDGSEDLVLHFVDRVSSSYVSKQMPGKAHRLDGGGFTRVQAGMTGSEFYKFPVVDRAETRLTALGYAKLAAHEAMHNMTGLNNFQLHGTAGIAGFPPHLPLNGDNKAKAQGALGNIPNQLPLAEVFK